jgi:hypothetical protein
LRCRNACWAILSFAFLQRQSKGTKLTDEGNSQRAIAFLNMYWRRINTAI